MDELQAAIVQRHSDLGAPSIDRILQHFFDRIARPLDNFSCCYPANGTILSPIFRYGWRFEEELTNNSEECIALLLGEYLLTTSFGSAFMRLGSISDSERIYDLLRVPALPNRSRTRRSVAKHSPSSEIISSSRCHFDHAHRDIHVVISS